MKKTTTLTLGSLTALAGINHSDAAIIYFDVNPDQTINVSSPTTMSFGDINLGSKTYTFNSFTGPAFGLDFNSVDGGLFLYLGTSGTSIDWGISGGYTPRLALDDSISAASPWSWSPSSGDLVYGYIGGSANWGTYSGTVTGFAPLRLDAGGGNFNYGWAEVTYSNIGSTYTENAIATVTGFAFEDQINTAILAGDQGTPSAVPEPGQVASSILLLAGIAGYLAYRRRMGAATEPDALHKLALGSRGIADFRADKAA